jgi:hypothetical protein
MNDIRLEVEVLLLYGVPVGPNWHGSLTNKKEQKRTNLIATVCELSRLVPKEGRNKLKDV